MWRSKILIEMPDKWHTYVSSLAVLYNRISSNIDV
jgi:hypothetical protein